MAGAPSNDEDLKEHLLHSIDKKETFIEFPARKQSITKAFSEFIPYRGQKLYESNQVAEYADKDENPRNLRDHYIFAVLLSLLSLFSVTTQILFMIYVSSPYRWISVGITVFNHLIAGCVTGSTIFGEIDTNLWCVRWCVMLVGGCCCGFPLAAIATVIWPIGFAISNRNSARYEDHFLPVFCLIHLLVTVFQTLPHFILLLIMILGYDFELNTDHSNILNWVFLSSILSIVTIGIIISSVFQQTAAFVFNCVWLWFDMCVVTFILFATMYDTNTFIIFCIDICLLALLYLIFLIMIMIAMNGCIFHDGECVVGIIICCLGPIVGLIGIPFVYVISLLPLCLIDQYLCWNIFPYCIRIAHDDEGKHQAAWLQYVLYEWIRYGKNESERYDRLCCTNMVIMDADSKYRKQYHDLMKDIGSNIKTSKQFTTVSGKQMAEQIYLNVSKLTNPLGLADIDDDEDSVLKKIFLTVFKIFLFCYFMNRFIHLVIPFVFAIYIGYKANWNVNNISVEIKFSFYGMMIVFVLCIVSVIYAWKSLYYYRLILPITKDANLEEIRTHISNCHGHVTLLRVLIDWCETMGGNRDIANIIFGYCGVETIQKGKAKQ